ncbi:hypothetical protein ACTMTI_54905 [Nonomuraea sp. H19]|uniref:hypothetical protein n=1 Tax=Nonomuraea sp. H19 TaxID=3452206 RepID=UPI003F8B4DD2
MQREWQPDELVGSWTLVGEDWRLSPLFWSHINLYGRFRLDMDTRLELPVATRR